MLQRNETNEALSRNMRRLGGLIGVVLLALSLFAAAVLVLIPKATGSHTYSVLTRSMAPHFPPGTFLVVKPVGFEELGVGDIITYQIESGRPEVVTHRVISVGATQKGERTLITKGDNNSLKDEEPVREPQLRGKLFYAVPHVGFATNALGNSDRGLALQVAAAGLVGYGLLTFVHGMTNRKRRRGVRAPVDGKVPAPESQPKTVIP